MVLIVVKSKLILERLSAVDELHTLLDSMRSHNLISNYSIMPSNHRTFIISLIFDKDEVGADSLHDEGIPIFALFPRKIREQIVDINIDYFG